MLLFQELDQDSKLDDEKKIGASLLAPVGAARVVEELPSGNGGGDTDRCVDRLPVSTLPVVRGNGCVVNSPVELCLVENRGDADFGVDGVPVELPEPVGAEVDCEGERFSTELLEAVGAEADG